MKQKNCVAPDLSTITGQPMLSQLVRSGYFKKFDRKMAQASTASVASAAAAKKPGTKPKTA
jgi:peptide deformylase